MNAATGFWQLSLIHSAASSSGAPADFADQDHRFRFRIVIEKLHCIEMRHAVNRVASDADAGRLSMAA